MSGTEQRSFTELYNKFTHVYDRLTAGRRDMKNFHDLLNYCHSAEERYVKDIENALRKQTQPILSCSMTDMYNEVKSAFTQVAKLHGSMALTYKEICDKLEKSIKEVKVQKTRLMDAHNKLVRELDQKKVLHAKAKRVYDESVEKAEVAVANFRAGRSQVGNDKAVKKLEENMTSASRELEKNHQAYLKAVRECQIVQEKYEAENEAMLLRFQELETIRMSTYHALMNSFVTAQDECKQQVTAIHTSLSTTFYRVNIANDINQFIRDTYDGRPLEAHVVYEPRSCEVIPHYGDTNAIQESINHVEKVQANHRRLMVNSTYEVASYKLPQREDSAEGNGINNDSFGAGSLTKSTSAAFQPANSPGAGLSGPPLQSATATAASTPPPFEGSAPPFASAVDPSPAAETTPAEAPTPLYVTALYDFPGQEPGDLSFHTNDIIQLVSFPPGEDWWVGLHNGVQGNFPQSYVSEPTDKPVPVEPAEVIVPLSDNIDPPPLAPGALFMVRAIFDFTPTEDDELPLQAGNFVSVMNVMENWYEGVLADGRSGMFPENHVERI